MQTEYCIGASIRVAFEYGYEVIIPEMTNTTVDNEYTTAEQVYNHCNFDEFDYWLGDVKTMDETIEVLHS